MRFTPVVVLLVLAAPAHAGKILYVDRVEVRATKSDNRSAWDAFNGKPDLKVSVERTSRPKGEKHVTAPAEDTLRAVFDRPALGVEEGDEIQIRVLDEDATSDDEVGSVTRTVTKDMLRSGEVELTFDQVDKLVLRFK